jgi:hypothetical protein
MEFFAERAIYARQVYCGWLWLFGRRGNHSSSNSTHKRPYADWPNYYRHQLGLHDAANAFWLSDKERIIRQRTFITLRIFDTYVTSCLGLPRNLRPTDLASLPTESSYIACPEMIAAANANLELLDILSEAREIFFTDGSAPGGSSYFISAARLHELNTTLDRWARKYHVSTQHPDDSAAASTNK